MTQRRIPSPSRGSDQTVVTPFNIDNNPPFGVNFDFGQIGGPGGIGFLDSTTPITTVSSSQAPSGSNTPFDGSASASVSGSGLNNPPRGGVFLGSATTATTVALRLKVDPGVGGFSVDADRAGPFTYGSAGGVVNIDNRRSISSPTTTLATATVPSGGSTFLSAGLNGLGGNLSGNGGTYINGLSVRYYTSAGQTAPNYQTSAGTMWLTSPAVTASLVTPDGGDASVQWASYFASASVEMTQFNFHDVTYF